MLNQKYAEASVEVLDILNHMNEKEKTKVSKTFINFLEQNASKDYVSQLDYSKKLNNMELKEETRGLLTIMYKNYWCPEDEKENLQKILLENDKKYQEELKESYSLNDIFNKPENEIEITNTETQNISVVPYKESFINKIVNKIKVFFHKKVD